MSKLLTELDKKREAFSRATQLPLPEAFGIILQLASEGEYPPACNWLGEHYEDDKNDNVEAAKWYKRSADLGDAEGALHYAEMLMGGYGVKKDWDESIKYYSISASKGNPIAAKVMGNYYLEKGENEKALEMYKIAADVGDREAQKRIRDILG